MNKNQHRCSKFEIYYKYKDEEKIHKEIDKFVMKNKKVILDYCGVTTNATKIEKGKENGKDK